MEVFNSWTFQIYFALSGALMIVEPIICALTPLDHGPLFKGSFEIDDDTMLHVYNKTNSSQLLYTEKNNHHQGPGRNVHGWSDYFIAQLCILGFSTFLHFFGTSVEALFVFGVLQGDSRKIEERKKKQDKIKSKPGGHYLDITEPTFYEKIWMVYDGAELLELILLLWGWGFIFERTGVAMLRCFRIFRLIYYFDVAEKHEQHIKKNNEHKDHFQELSTDEKQMKEQRIHYEKLMHVHDSENRGSRFLRFPHVCHIIMVYFRKLYEELFTEASRGGLIVISLFFYTTFVFALMFYNETSTLTDVDNPPTACGDLSTCYIRLMRLVFYDGMFLYTRSCYLDVNYKCMRM